MADNNVLLPSKPRIVREEGNTGVFEIDGLYPGYGHTLGNSLRRIILSSLPGAAVTSVKISGVSHEFSTIEGVKEDVITIILHLKKLRMKVATDEPQTLMLRAKGIKEVTAGDIEVPGQVEILNPELKIATLTDKNADLTIEMVVERGLGYVPKETLHKDKVDIGTIHLDATFAPIRRVNYEVENMRVGNRTDFNRLKIHIETDGTLTSREALENSIEIMINQLRAIVGFVTEEPIALVKDTATTVAPEERKQKRETDSEILKTRIETLELPPRITSALLGANIRTVGGLVRKKEEDLLDIEGLGNKGVQEVKKALADINLSLKA
jgi:DNA-directed RNA polymerase subunit alpha